MENEGQKVPPANNSRKGKGNRSKAATRALRRNQAQRVIDKFGGIPALIRLLNEVESSKVWNRSSVWRWLEPKEKGGTNGVIPTKAMPILLKAARLHGILLTPEDFYPGLY